MMPETPIERAEQRGLHISPELSITGALTVLTMFATIIIWAVSTSNHTEVLAGQMVDLKAAIINGQQDIRQQISTLPDQRAKLDELERRVTDLETRFNVFGDRLNACERSDIEMRADLAPLLRALNGPLPVARRK
jgi:cell division protein FtsB